MRSSRWEVVVSCLISLTCAQITHNLFPNTQVTGSCGDLIPNYVNCTKECSKQSKICYTINWTCHDFNKQGPCDEGDVLVLQKDALCGETECIPHDKMISRHTNCIEECYAKSKICYARDFSCHDINKQGPCGEEEILVLLKNGLRGETVCVPNPSLDCPSDWVRYNGECFSPHNPTACGPVNKARGLRILQNAYGDIMCECARHLGFLPNVERRQDLRIEEISTPSYEQPCYHEYLQGPCKDGQQLIENGDGPICKNNSCETKGEFQWRDGKCYPLGPSANSCKDILGWMEDEDHIRKIECMHQFDTRTTVENCPIRASDGSCLPFEKLPDYDIDLAIIERAMALRSADKEVLDVEPVRMPSLNKEHIEASQAFNDTLEHIEATKAFNDPGVFCTEAIFTSNDTEQHFCLDIYALFGISCGALVLIIIVVIVAIKICSHSGTKGEPGQGRIVLNQINANPAFSANA